MERGRQTTGGNQRRRFSGLSDYVTEMVSLGLHRLDYEIRDLGMTSNGHFAIHVHYYEPRFST